MVKYKYPHTIENGHGEQLTFRRRVTTPTGERVEGDNVVTPGAGPPMHVHYFEQEEFIVTQGRLGYQLLGGEPQFAGVGETATFPPGVAHKFWNAGNEDLKCDAYVSPPGNVEFFLTAMFDAQKRGKNGRPDIFDSAYLAWRYRSEYAMLEIPSLVQKLVFPVIVMIGTALGKYRKYADAPAPRTR